MFKVNCRKGKYELVGGCAVVAEVSGGVGLIIINCKEAGGQFDPSCGFSKNAFFRERKGEALLFWRCFKTP